MQEGLEIGKKRKEEERRERKRKEARKEEATYQTPPTWVRWQ
jgi:hypothetical protein